MYIYIYIYILRKVVLGTNYQSMVCKIMRLIMHEITDKS